MGVRGERADAPPRGEHQRRAHLARGPEIPVARHGNFQTAAGRSPRPYRTGPLTSVPRLVTERADVLPALAELFREHGFEGASLSLIGRRTGLGKGSLYHFFPGGKEEMAAAVLDEIDGWFRDTLFTPLREAADPRQAILRMFPSVEAYFQSGR